jgi:hypothetical protein
MKMHLLVPFTLLFSVSLFAEQPEKAASKSELSKLRHEYLGSLEKLQQQYVEAKDVANAVAVSRELDKMAQKGGEASTNASPSGRWAWLNGTRSVISPDGIVTNTSGEKAIWYWQDKEQRKLQIEWEGGYTDQATLSPDGTRLLMTNNFGRHFEASRLPFFEIDDSRGDRVSTAASE